jgi:hypothetical protein
MAIHYLLYACVECGREGGIKPGEKGEEVCERCHTRYARVNQADIRCEPPNQPAVVHSAAEWLDLLHEQGLHRLLGRSAQVVVRIADKYRPYRHAGVYLGEIEQLGEPMTGTLTVDQEAVRFTAEGGASFVWPLDELTAVQPSSTSLQLKIRRGPIIALKFPGNSPLLWEERIRYAVQARYTAKGLGEIIEYQPRIVCG